MFATCANPLCLEPFDYHHGGKFFRFHPNRHRAESSIPFEGPNTHDVEHFWLCAHCAEFLTLVYDEQQGVVVKPRSDDFSAAESHKQLIAI